MRECLCVLKELYKMVCYIYKDYIGMGRGVRIVIHTRENIVKYVGSIVGGCV